MSEFNIFAKESFKVYKKIFICLITLVKYLYQYLNFFLKSDKNFSFKIHPDAKILNISNKSLFFKSL